MRKRRGIWPHHWRRGPDLKARIRTRRSARRLAVLAAAVGGAAVIGLQIVQTVRGETTSFDRLMAAAPQAGAAKAAGAE